MLDSDHFKSSNGTIEEVGGNHVIRLTGAPGAWFIDAGKVDVFAARFAGDAPLSRRRYIARFTTGNVLFASPHSDSEYVLFGVPVGQCRIREISERLFNESSTRADSLHVLCGTIDLWVEKIASGVFDVMPPKEHTVAVPGDVLVIESGRFVRNTGETVWTLHENGESCLMGLPQLKCSEAAVAATPVGPHLWLESTMVSEVRCFSTLDRMIEGATHDDIAGFHQTIIRAVQAAEINDRRKDRDRLKKKEEDDWQALTDAVSHLAAVMSAEAKSVVRTSDPLLAACNCVGNAASIEVRVPVEREVAESRGRLERIAAASHFRVRRVALREGWWRFDAGPMLGLVVQSDGLARSPIALIPRPSGSYDLVDPMMGRSIVVDEEVSATLSPFAYSFYRPFRNRALRAWDIFKFAAEGCRGDFLMILLMGLAAGVLGLAAPIITGVIFNSVIPGAERIQLMHMIGALLACTIATAFFQLVRGLAVLRVESKMDASVQAAVWDRLLNLSTSFFRRFAAGDLAVRAGGISEIRRLLSGATTASLLSGLFSIFNLALLFYYDAGLALCAVAMTLLALTVLLIAGFLQLRYQRGISMAQTHLSGQVLQYITGITKLRVAGAEAKSYERWASAFADQRRLQFEARRIGNVLSTFNAAFPVLSMMVIFGAMVVQDDALMATGDFIAFNGAFGAFTANMMSATGAIIAMMMSIPIYEQAQPILESLPEVTAAMVDPGVLNGEIEVSHATFRYDPDGEIILNEVSISAKPGEFVALVGPSGSGKSTILRLLLGFEQPDSGSIYFDGQDIAGLDVTAVRRQIGVVLQNGGMMSGDVFTNITGSSLATLDDAWDAARMAGLEEDIRQMPMGMHTVISEGGTTLSGGQRQRLLIARAVVNRPRLLFFDEATSALDNRTQAVVSESLERLQATRIVVAHRLSTIINADRIYVLDRGRVVQTGTYATLLEEGGLFADLVRRQMA